MQTAHEFFLHEMNDMLDAERKLVEALGEQAEESTSPEVRRGFEMHRKQTQGQVERLERALQEVGAQEESTECAGIKGLKEEHDNFKKQDPAADLLDIFNVGAAKKVERYEISAYESMIQLAREMGHSGAARLLQQNLREEQQTLKKLGALSKKLKPKRLGMGMGEEAGSRRRSPQRAASRSGRRRTAA